MENNESIEAPKRTFWQKLKRFLGYSILTVVVAGFVINLVWRYSGSDEWVQEPTVNGVQLYSKKTPGRDMLHYKAIVRTKSSLAAIVALMKDASVCEEMGCYDSRMFEQVTPQEEYFTYKFRLPKIFKPRDFSVKMTYEQDPKTKEVEIVITAMPEKLPVDDCCLRITDMNNIWRVRPADNGEVEVEYIISMDEGGMLPDLMLNTGRPDFLGKIMPLMVKVLSREKYQQAKFDFITE